MSGIVFPQTLPIENFRLIEGPLVDLRTPNEFLQGHWPGARNIPLFSNEERAEIGIAYKKDGQKMAIALGLEIISPKLSTLIKSLKQVKNETDASFKNQSISYLKLYCWRGGMRSASVAWLSNIYNLKPVLLKGGYKSYRNWVLKQFKKKWPLKLIGGKTGTGKTTLLLSLKNRGLSIIDLEGLANHRGSTFGSLGLPSQPTNEHYENKIGESLEHFSMTNNSEILLEAESANLGKCRIPFEIFKQMKISKLVEIERSEEERINELVKVYGCQDQLKLEEATLRIRKRLGPQRTALAIKAIQDKNWKEACKAILDYYDRYYERELSKTLEKRSIDLSGLTSEESAEYLIKKGLLYPPNSSQS